MMIRPSNSGTATWVATSSGVRPSSESAQALSGPGQAQPLQDRDVQRGQGGDVPRLVVPAGGRGGRLGAAGRQHRDDQGVQRAELGQQVVGCAAQRRAEDRHRDGPVLRLHGVGQRMHERRVAGRLMRPVVQDPDPAALSAARSTAGRSSRPQAGSRVGGSKPSPVSSTVSQTEGVQLRRGCPARPRPGTGGPAPPPRSARWTAASARRPGSARRPARSSARRPRGPRPARPARTGRYPRIRTITRSAPSSTAGSSVADVEPGRVRQGVVGARTSGPESRSVSDVDSRATRGMALLLSR